MHNNYGIQPGRAAPKEKPPAPTKTQGGFPNQQRDAIIAIAEKTGNPSAKQYATLRAKFALTGRTLNRAHRAHDGRAMYIVSTWREGRYFSHLSDVVAHLAAIGGRP